MENSSVINFQGVLFTQYTMLSLKYELFNCKLLQKHSGIIKRPPFYQNNYLPLTVICQSLQTGTDNPDQPILNKQSHDILLLNTSLNV